MILALCFLAFGFLVTFITTPAMIRMGSRGFGLDNPNQGRKSHSAPVSRLGGGPLMLAMLLGAGTILAIEPSSTMLWLPVMLGSLLMFGLGLWDDLYSLGARRKLAGQVLIATLAYSLGLNIDRVSYTGAAWSIELGHVSSYLATVFWLVAVPNIVNLIDGFDGLAGGLGVFMSATLGIVGIFSQQMAVAWYAFTLTGALIGFLVFNFPPAKIFLGDGGAYLIGYSIASLSLFSSNKGSVAAVLLVTIIALGVPILDTSFAILRRGVRGFPLFHPDDEHVHHKLERLGVSKRRIVLGLYGVCVVLSLIALSVFWSQGRTLPIGIGALFVLAALVLRYFHFVKSWEDVPRRISRVMNRRGEVRYVVLQARVMELEVERCKTGEEFWPIFQGTLRRVGFVSPGEVENDITLRIKHNGDVPWVLHAPCNGSHAWEWKRIAECFQPIYSKAVMKWPV